MKLSSITNKWPEGQWFEYNSELKVFLTYGQSLEAKLTAAVAEFAVNAAAAIEENDASAAMDAEKQSTETVLRIICEDHFLNFEAKGGLQEDDGTVIENSLATRMRLMAEVPDLHDFIDVRISNYDYWTQ